jgi:putative membrane protein insertion efficiency factor
MRIFNVVFTIFIKQYQIWFSPFLGSHCRFTPSCSHYALDCLKEFNIFKALLKISYRILRCNPWCKGGNDPASKPKNWHKEKPIVMK